MPGPDKLEGSTDQHIKKNRGRNPWTREEIQVDILTRIKDGEYQPGDPFPSFNSLISSYESSRGVIGRAIGPFRRRKVIIVGKSDKEGSFLSDRKLQPDVLEDLEEEILMQPTWLTRQGVNARQITEDETAEQSTGVQLEHGVRIRRADGIIRGILKSITDADPEIAASIEAAADIAMTPVGRGMLRRKATRPSDERRETKMTQRIRIPSQLREETPVIILGGPEESSERELPPLKLSTVAALAEAVGNSEVKAILFSIMQPGARYTSNALYHRIRENMTPDVWQKFHENEISILLEHFPQELITIGSGPNGSKTFTRTEDEIGDLAAAFAGRSLTFSADHPEVSLSQIQSARYLDADAPNTVLSGTLLRIRLLQELAGAGGTIPQQQLAEALFGDSHKDHHVYGLLDQHLQRLSDAGLIILEKRERGKSYAKFVVKDSSPDKDITTTGDARGPRRYKALEEQILSVITPQDRNGYVACPGPFTYDLLYKVMSVKYPEIRRFKDIKGVRRRMSVVVSNLIRDGMIENIGLREDEQKRIRVTGNGRDIFNDYVDMIESFKNGTRAYFEQSQRLGDVPEKYSQLMVKAQLASPYTSKPEPVSVESHIQGSTSWLHRYIADDLRSRILNGEEIDSSQKNRLAFTTEYQISFTAIDSIFRRLKSEGLFIK